METSERARGTKLQAMRVDTGNLLLLTWSGASKFLQLKEAKEKRQEEPPWNLKKPNLAMAQEPDYDQILIYSTYSSND